MIMIDWYMNEWVPGFLMEELGFQNDFFDASIHFEGLDKFPNESVFGLFEGSVRDHNNRLVSHRAMTGHSNNIRGDLVYVDLKEIIIIYDQFP